MKDRELLQLVDDEHQPKGQEVYFALEGKYYKGRFGPSVGVGSLFLIEKVANGVMTVVDKKDGQSYEFTYDPIMTLSHAAMEDEGVSKDVN